MSDKANFFSLVPEGSPHRVEGKREIMLPGLSLEIYATRKIRLQRWELDGLCDSYWRLYLPVEGSASVTWEGTTFDLRPGQAYLIPPRTTFSASNPEPFTKWYVHFILGSSDFASLPGIHEFPVDSRMQRWLARLEDEPGDPYPWDSASLVIHALEQLPAHAWSHQKLDPRVEKALDFLKANQSRKINAEDTARAAGLSIRNLNHLFRTQLRMAPMSVLLNHRLDKACHMLRHSDASIEQVAESCGFANRYYLSRMLKQHRGISPAAYRKGQLY